MGMELRKRPRPRRLDPDFVSSPPPTPPRKRARKQPATKKLQQAAVKEPATAREGPRRIRCARAGIGSPVAGLEPSRCCQHAAPRSRSSFIVRSRVPFNWYEPDIWTEVAKHLHGIHLACLARTCRWFRRLLADDSIWRYAFIRDLSLPTGDRRLLIPRPRHRSWRHLYATAFDNTHAYCFRQREKHIDWIRIGGFIMDTSKLLLTGTLALPRWMPPADDGPRISIEMTGSCLLTNARRGIWIADINIVRCPVCNINNCKGTMQVLDARHCELYLEEKFRDGTWEYEELGHYIIDGKLDTAAAAIFNLNHINSTHVANILNAKSWIRRRHDLLPKGRLTPVAVALNSNLKSKDRLLSKFQAMRDMSRDGEIVSVRITQQLL